MEPPPKFLVRLLHSVPHVNITLHRVNDTFNPTSKVYKESLGILASIPAALLILSLVGLLLYLLTRCCDRKPRKAKSQTCQKCTLITTTLFCCAAIGLGLYGNDDFHNGLLQSFGSGREIKGLVSNFTNKTSKLNEDIRTNILMSDLWDMFNKPAHNQTALMILMDNMRLITENTSRASTTLQTILLLLNPSDSKDPNGYYLKKVLEYAEKYEPIRWPATLGFLTVLLLLCTVLVIGVARNSRCALIFFSVFGLFAVIICWLLSGIYLASSVALGDFCMRPTEFVCRQAALKIPDDVYYLNCGSLRNRFILRLNESRGYFENAREAFKIVSSVSRDIYPKLPIGDRIERINNELLNSKYQITELTGMLDRRTVDRNYNAVINSICSGGLLGLSLMMVASLITAFLLTLLVCVDSHAWIYLTKRRPYGDKSETQPFLNSSASTASPSSAPILSGTSTINRTLLHHHHNQQPQLPQQPLPQQSLLNSATSTIGRNGTTGGLRGLAYSGDSPPPDYNIVLHDINRLSHGHNTLGRLPSHSINGPNIPGPNNGKYATLSKQCKTLEANDFY